MITSGESQHELSGWEKVRPVQIAFLVEASEHNDVILDAIFADSYSRWGGRFSLIVPCANKRVVDEYWPWLETHDPDIVYSYVDLQPEAILDIHERLVPADYINHNIDGGRNTDAWAFRPKYDFAMLSSMSTIFRLARHSPIAEGKKVKIIDSWHTETPSRLLTDNLGTYRTSAATGMYPNDAMATAGLLTIVSNEYVDDRKFGIPRDLDRIPSEYRAFSEFLNRRATGISLLSSLYAPRIEIPDHGWSSAFNLVVGDAFEDRLLFWNARLLIPSWLDGDLCCFRVSIADLNDEEFVGLLAQLINSRNHVNDGSGQAQLKLRSASHNVDELKEVLDRLHKAKLWQEGGVEVIPGGHALPTKDSLGRSRETLHSLTGFFRKAEGRKFHWTPPFARPPAEAPDHLKDAPPGQAFTLGQWAIDLRLQHDQDGPCLHLGENEWVLPKRWRMAGAFEAKFETRGENQPYVARNRTNGEGSITLFAGVGALLESVKVPTVPEAMNYAFCRDAAIRRVYQDDPPWPMQKVQRIGPSNEAHYLIGVLGLAGGLSRASSLLLHPFVQKMLGDLGGTPNLADADVLGTANALAKRAGRQPVFNLNAESERAALAALIVKAAQSIKAPKMYVGLEFVRKRWEEYRAIYWTQHPNGVQSEEAVNGGWDERENRAVDDALAEMRSQRMLFQGYPWKCYACQHRNWTDFQALRPAVACDVCATEMKLPVGIPWHFRPNEFLIESLRSHSVLSLVWLLSALSMRAKNSFIYMEPSCFGYGKDNGKSDAEADLLVVIDGKAILCEIKSAWRSLRTDDLDSLVALAIRLRPDRAILAVMEIGGKLLDRIEVAKKTLEDAGIEFEILTPDHFQPDDAPYMLA